MFPRLEAAGEGWKSALGELEPESMIGRQPAAALDTIRRIERATAAAKLEVLARAAEMHPWQREGYGSFEEWLAAQDGTSTGRARHKTRTAKNMKDRKRVAEALADGDISEDEADVIADAADKNPEAETDLLSTAKNRGRSHNDLKDEAAKAKASGESDEARARRHREGRTARWGTDREGFGTLFGRLQPHISAEMQVRLDAEVDRQFALARNEGRREPLDRYRADALAALILGHQPHSSLSGDRADADRVGDAPTAPAPPSRNGPDEGVATSHANGTDEAEADGSITRVHKQLIIDIDFQALRRGMILSGETCSIRGVGPVPVEIARAWFDDSFIKAVIRDGDDVRTIAHFGRHIPESVRTALGIVDQTCAVPGCSNRRIEYDHDHRHTDHGPCSVDNLRPLCVPHHRQRTHKGYELRGPPGDRTWHGPEGNILFADDPDKLEAEFTLF